MTDTTAVISVCDTLTADGAAGAVLPLLPRVDGAADAVWLNVSLVAVLIGSIFLLALYKKQYLFQIRGLFSAPNSRKVVYDTDSRGVWGTVLFWLIVVFSHSVFLAIVMERMTAGAGGRVGETGFMLLLFVCVALLFAGKYVALRAGGYIFDMRERAAVFSDGYFVLVFMQGIVLLPVVIAAIYAFPPVDNVFVVIGLAVMAITEILVVVKGVQTFFTGWLSLFYIFLYLCASEFLPVMLLAKALPVL